MKISNTFIIASTALALTASLQSCLDKNTSDDSFHTTAIVTVCPGDNGAFTMNLDNSTVLVPSNLNTSPFGGKEVRALVNYTDDDITQSSSHRTVHVNWIDSILTKKPVLTGGPEADTKYGDDPIEIVNDWMTVAEDGYITLRVRTLWGDPATKHLISLIAGTNPENPCELELRHNANGDIHGVPGDALIAFNLNGLPQFDDKSARVTLRWNSFSGERTTQFSIEMRPRTGTAAPAQIPARPIE